MTSNRLLLSPAAELVLAAARLSDGQAEVLRLCGGEMDWEELCALAEQEKAASVVLEHLGRVSLPAAESGCKELRPLATVSVMRMLQLERLLHQALETLGGQGIAVMLLKGAALAYTTYASFAERPMGDLDLLVRAADAEPAWSLLQTAGWTWPSSVWVADSYRRHQHLPPLVRQPGAFRLEVHTDLLAGGHPFLLPTDTLWARAREVTVNGRAVKVPHPVHQLWHVCVHFAWSHEMQWGAWRALRDAAAIVRRGELEWPEFVELARDSRAVTCCFWTLSLARRLAGAAVPSSVLAELRPPRPGFVRDRLERHYVLSLFPSRNRCPSLWLSRRLWEAGILPRWSGHRAARPWNVTQAWLAGTTEEESRQPSHPSLRGRLRQLTAMLGYLRRMNGRALPHGPG